VVVDDPDAARLQTLTPPLVLSGRGLQARMTRTARAMVGDRTGPLHELLAVKQQQHAAPDTKRDAIIPARDHVQPEQLAVEAPDSLPNRAVVIEHRLKQPGETWRLHDIEAIRGTAPLTKLRGNTVIANETPHRPEAVPAAAASRTTSAPAM
jgi:hypothetical protein